MTRPLLSNLQILRFFAAAAVLVGHGCDLFFPNVAALRRIPWSAGVDVFFVISGFVMIYLTQGQFGAPGASAAFLLRRIIRIVPPYWLFTTLMVATVLLFGEHVRNTELSGGAVVTSYFFMPSPRADGELNPLLSQGWTLNYEAFFYLAFALALFLRRGMLWLAAAFLVMALVNPLIPASAFVIKFWTDPIILEFLGGAGLGILFLRGVRLPGWASFGIAVTALALFLLTETLELESYRRLIHAGLPSLLLCASLALAPEPASSGPVRSALIVGGDSSYTLYLSHTFTLNAVAIAWKQAGSPLPLLTMSFGCALAIAVAAIIYRRVERPMTDALHARAGTRPSRGAAAVAP